MAALTTLKYQPFSSFRTVLSIPQPMQMGSLLASSIAVPALTSMDKPQTARGWILGAMSMTLLESLEPNRASAYYSA